MKCTSVSPRLPGDQSNIELTDHQCQAGHNGSLPQIFHMEVYNSLAEHMADNLTRLDKPRFKVTDLSPSTSYVLVIYASNVKGRSDSVALVATTLSTAERRTGTNFTSII
ncbi:fibronectin type-III domain-containing protein [Trichonephila inaurata madagascariensis]|uniref:Fibronectin type-III domain-containing protein n=1 Tax=Trichonephila inaurata madagascariensis TaxID=2747483 RepID=A0A8X6M9G3_9ARAC|nr:fibronectin type-III domain-containing protein [Trichonephila inaurata madagascariensis]